MLAVSTRREGRFAVRLRTHWSREFQATAIEYDDQVHEVGSISAAADFEGTHPLEFR